MIKETHIKIINVDSTGILFSLNNDMVYDMSPKYLIRYSYTYITKLIN